MSATAATAPSNPTAAPPSTTPYASASLYVGDLATDVTEALLFDIFNAVGPVASVRVCRDAATRRSLGYAYVNFHRVEDAERALDTMNFTAIRNRACRIMWSHRDPSLRKSGQGNIFVKNLAPTIDNKTLYDTFSMFGNILSCKVAVNSKGESLGYGFVHYESEDAATTAIASVHGMQIAGVNVTVEPFRSKKERGGFDKTKYTNVYVKNLPDDIKKQDMDDLFAAHGPITSSMLATDGEGKGRGFGFVNFGEPTQAAAAVEALNGFEWRGETLYVARAQKREERERELRQRFEQLKVERQKKYAGVNLYVKNLADNLADDDLRREFAKFGDITSARVMRDAANKSKGFGFVCFATPEEAQRAVTEMNGKMLEGKPLYVALAQRKEVRRAQLEAQYAARARQAGGMPGAQPGPMGYPQPMFYAPPGVPRGVVYQGQMGMPPRRWNPNPAAGGRPNGGPMMHPMPYGGMGGHMNGGARAGPRGQGRGGGANQQFNNQQFKYNANVRNRDAAPQHPPAATTAAPAQPQVPGVSDASQQLPLTIQALAAAPVERQKQMIGERLFPLIHQQEPHLAGKITGMLLEMDNGELLHLLESAEARQQKIQEALEVLHRHQAREAETVVTEGAPAAAEAATETSA